MTRKIPLSEPVFAGNEWKYLKDCLDSGWVSSGGKYVERFENEIASLVGVKHAVATVNGTAAIHTALMVAGITHGDIVMVPTLTFIATANPVMYCSARPFFLDCEGETFNLDPEKLLCAVKKLDQSGQKPKAVIVTHLYGHPCDMDPIMEVANRYGMVVIEDASEAIGAKYKGKSVGRLGHIGCFSFNGNKLITSGGGGMLVTDLSEYAKRARYLTAQARDDKLEFVHHEVGYNYRLTNLQAALGLAQLERVYEFIETKRAIASYYQNHLKGVQGIKVVEEAPWAYSSFWLVPILIDTETFGLSSRELCHFLGKQSIESRPFFCPLHRLHPFRGFASDHIEIADRVYEQGLLLPSSLSLTEADLNEVVNRILQVNTTPTNSVYGAMQDGYVERFDQKISPRPVE